MNIQEIIVVEGKQDTNKIKTAVRADTIETNGSAISEETLKVLVHAAKKRGIIIFTDPDFAGERIRHIISKRIPESKHAFLSKDKARSHREKESLGIEHATIEDIREALTHVYDVQEEGFKSNITQKDLIRSGLIGHPHAQTRRARLGDLLHIGSTNGKQLLRRLHMFQITKDELNRAIEHIIKGED